MNRLAITTAAAVVLAGPALADSHLSQDAAFAMDEFRQCATCHVIQDDDGEVIAGRNAKTGPNLHCVIGRTAGTYDGFRYGKDIVAAGEQGLVWDEAHMVTYLQDPTAFLREYTGDAKARSKMTFKVRKTGDKSPEEVAAAFAALLAETCDE